MAVGISVRKVFEDDFRVSYQVKSDNYGGLHYFISLKKGEERIYIYKDIGLTEILGLIDLSKPDEVVKIPGVPNQALWFSVINLVKSMKSNTYPDGLDYAC